MKHWFYAVLVLTVCGVTLHAAPATQPANDAAKLVEAQLNRILPEVNFDGVGFSDAVDFLSDLSGANLFVDWKRLDQAKVARIAPVRVKVKNEKFRDVLQAVIDSAAGKGKTIFVTEAGFIVISTQEGAALFKNARIDVSQWDQKARLLMSHPLPAVAFDGVSLTECADYLRDLGGMKMDVDWAALEKEGTKKDTPVSVKLHNASFGDTLWIVFQSVSDKPIRLTPDGDGGLRISPSLETGKPAK